MNREKAVILNYHRLLQQTNCPAKFHDVPFDSFKKQMELVAARKSAGNLSMQVVITFDDGTGDHALAAELLSALGLTGVFFIITNRLGCEGNLTRSQVCDLVKQGHIVGSHSASHRYLPALSVGEMRKELTESKQLLENLTGIPVDWFAPPGGQYSAQCVNLALTAGYQIFRTTDWGYANLPICGQVPCLPVLPSYDLDVFERLLDGRAPLWRYTFKTWLKRGLGEKAYLRIRNGIGIKFRSLNFFRWR